MKYLKFENGDSMPIVGLGTWKAQGEDVQKAVKLALNLGYRHIDTAAIYGNEEEIGLAIKEAINEGIVTRDELFITSKLWNDAHIPADVLPALEESLTKLGLDYLDLYLVHWPVAFQPGIAFPSQPDEYLSLDKAPIIGTWDEMIKCKSEGLAKHIGVSNFSKTKLEDLLSKTKVAPEMNQVEMHPLLQQDNLFKYCNDKKILLTAYSPLGSGDRSEQMKAENEPNLMGIPEINAVANKHNLAAAEVLLAWHANRGNSVIPKSTSEGHLKSNLASADIQLNNDEMETIAQLDKNYRFINGKFFEMPGSGYSNIYDE